MIEKIGHDYIPFRDLILTLLYTSNKFLFWSGLGPFFLEVLKGNPFKELDDPRLYGHVLEFAERSEEVELLALVRPKVETCTMQSRRQKNVVCHSASYFYASLPVEPSTPDRDYPLVGDIESPLELNSLGEVAVSAPIPDELCGVHLRLQYELIRADCIFEVCSAAAALAALQSSSAVPLSDVELRKAFKEKNAQNSAVRLFVPLKITKMTVNQNSGFGYVFRAEKKLREDTFLVGNLMLLSAHRFRASKPIYVCIVQSEGKDDRGDNTFSVQAVSAINAGEVFEGKGEGGIFLNTSSSEVWTGLLSPAFFKPLQMAMKRLRELGAQLPLQAGILRGQTDEPPTYVFEKREFRVGKALLAKEGMTSDTLDVLDAEAWDNYCENWSEEVEKGLLSSEEFRGRRHALDATQRASLQHIFSHNVAVVEGTPGTGKTFVLAKFVQLLLDNWDEDSGPVLCITLTNNAADAFLKDVMKLMGSQGDSEGFIRLGRRCCEELQRFSFYGSPPSFRYRKWCYGVSREMERMNNVFAHDRKYFETVEKLLKSGISGDDPFRSSRAFPPWHGQSLRELVGELSRLLPNHIKKGELRNAALEAMHSAEENEYWTQYDAINRAVNALDSACTQMGYPSELWSWKLQAADICSSLETEQIFLLWLSPGRADFLDRVPTRVRELFLQFVSFEPHLRVERYFPAEIERLVAKAEIVIPGYGQLLSQRGLGLKRTDKAFKAAPANEKKVEGSKAKETACVTNGLLEDSIAVELERVACLYSGLSSDVLCHLSLRRREALLGALILLNRHQAMKRIMYLVRSNEGAELLAASDAERARRNSEKFSQAQLIIGTTDAVMTNLAALQLARPSVVVVEEAAEILEAHVLACLTDSVEHLVLVGDHKQLHPKVNNYYLETQKGLGVSLQERLIMCGADYCTLSMQRRMHPILSRFVQPYYIRIVKKGDRCIEIEDHPRTHRIEEPHCIGWKDGTCLRSFLVCYEGKPGVREEEVNPYDKSYFNLYEAKVVEAVGRLIYQYYPTKSIVVLTAYTGQLFEVKNALQHFQRTIRIRTIDDFQGEEADFVILSLTRTSKAGFLVRDNRSCVALSRARMGCYVVGCKSVIAEASSVLKDFVNFMEKDGTINSFFPARCREHNHFFTFDDMKTFESQRCRATCGYRLDRCGHICKLRCHGPDHKNARCDEACERVGVLCNPPRVCSHPCRKLCRDSCGLCEEVVEYRCPSCAVTVELSCFQAADPLKFFQCSTSVTIPAAESPCRHELTTTCSKRTLLVKHPEEFYRDKPCRHPCGAHMPCGHICRSTCHFGEDNLHERKKRACEQLVVVKNLKCEHRCEKKCCAVSYPPCKELCGKQIDGSSCICELPCHISEQKVKCSCKKEHESVCSKGHRYSLLCGAPEKCTEPCDFTLQCGHSCPGSCGVCAALSKAIDCSLDHPIVHRRCSKKCGKALPCGHLCLDGCGQACSPCAADCYFFCGHGVGCGGKHKCSDCVALQCQEACLWSCPHYSCDQRCSEPCQRPVCDERCSQMLPCGHRCCGLCGEPCPQFCIQCYREAARGGEKYEKAAYIYQDDVYIFDLKEFLMGDINTDTNVEMLLVQLPCCQRIFTVGYLDRAIRASIESNIGEDGSRKVTMPKCPLCAAPLSPNAYRRQGGLLRSCTTQVAKLYQQQTLKRKELKDENLLVLARLFCYFFPVKCGESFLFLEDEELSTKNEEYTKEDNNAKCLESFLTSCEHFQRMWEGCESSDLVEQKLWVEKLEKDRLSPRCAKEEKMWYKSVALWCWKVRREALYVSAVAEAIVEYTRILRYKSTHDSSVYSEHLPVFEDAEEYFDFLVREESVDYAMVPLAAKMLQWLSCLGIVLCFGQPLEKERMRASHCKLFGTLRVPVKSLLSSNVSLQDVSDALESDGRPLAEKVHNQFTKTLLRSVLGALQEKEQTLTPGHFYMCPNGHFYVIGNCGGAMITSRCPECQATIGGESHAVTRTNRSAATLFGEQYRPAWPQPQLED